MKLSITCFVGTILFMDSGFVLGITNECKEIKGNTTTKDKCKANKKCIYDKGRKICATDPCLDQCKEEDKCCFKQCAKCDKINSGGSDKKRKQKCKKKSDCTYDNDRNTCIVNPEGTVDCRTNQCDIDDVSFPSAAILSPACYNGSEKRFPFAEPILTPCDMCEGVVPTLEGLDDEDTCQNTCADIVFKNYPFPSSLQVIKKCNPLCVDIFEALRGCDTCDSSPTCVPRWGNGQQIVFCCADPPCCDTSPTCVPPAPSVSGTPSVEPSGNTPSGGGPTHEPSFIPTSIPLPGGDYCTYAPDPSCYSNDGKPDCCMDDSECPYDEPPCDVVSSAPPTPQSTDTSIIPSQGPTPESTDTSFIPTTLDFDDNEPQLIFCCPVRPEPSPSCDTCDSSPTCVPRWGNGQQLVFCCADPPCCDTSPTCVPRWGNKQLVFCCPLPPTPCQDVGLCTLFAEPEPEPIEPTPSCETCDKSDDCVPEFEVFGSEVQQVVFCCADPPCCDSSPTCKPEFGNGTQIGFCCPCAVCEEVVPTLAEFGEKSICKRKCAGIVEKVAGAVSTILKVTAECDQLCVDIYEENCLLENVCSRVGLCVPEPILPAYCFSCEEEIPFLEEAGVEACVETCREINNGLGAFCAPICNAIFQVFGVVIPKVICQYVGLCSILKQCDADKVIAPDALISIRESFSDVDETIVSGIRDSFEEIFSDEACFIGSKKVVPLNDEFTFLSSVAPISNCPDLYTHCTWKKPCEFTSQCPSVPPTSPFAPFTCKGPPGSFFGRCYEGPFPLCILLRDGTYKVECS